MLQQILYLHNFFQRGYGGSVALDWVWTHGGQGLFENSCAKQYSHHRSGGSGETTKIRHFWWSQKKTNA